MDRQTAKLLVMYLCFAEIFSISNGTSTTVDSAVSTPMPTTSATVGSFSEMIIQPSSTSASQDLLASSAKTFTSIVPSKFEMSTMISLMSKASISLGISTVTATPTPMTTDDIPITAPSTDLTTTYYTEATTNTKKGGCETTTVLPICTEILALIAIGLSGASCCCVVVFSLGCTLALTCRGSKKSRAKKEIQDSMFRSATLQRPLGDAIRDTFPVAIENPTFKDISTDIELNDASTLNRKDSTINGYSW